MVGCWFERGRRDDLIAIKGKLPKVGRKVEKERDWARAAPPSTRPIAISRFSGVWWCSTLVHSKVPKSRNTSTPS